MFLYLIDYREEHNEESSAFLVDLMFSKAYQMPLMSNINSASIFSKVESRFWDALRHTHGTQWKNNH